MSGTAHTYRSRGWAVVIDNSLLLVAGTVAALIWANLDARSYEGLTHGPLHFIVNDIGMVFFFALAAKEIIEARLPGGPLASPREAAVPLLAAAGGMIAPASIFVLLTMAVGRPELTPGWAVPCATDIAFSYLTARLIFPPDHPAIPFLLLLAIADDAMGLMLLALFYPSGPLSLLNFVLFMVPALGVSFWLKRRRTWSFWPYVLVGGGLSWCALYFGGVHPSLALVPILPFMPHEKSDLGLFDRREPALPYAMNQFARGFHVPVQFILLLFGLVNAGVPFGSVGSGTWIVFVSLLVGKPAGILLMTAIGVKFGLRPPGGLSYPQVFVVGVTAAIGFTVALFFTTAAFEPGPVLDEAKMGALFSFAAAPAAMVLGRVMKSRRPRTSSA
ncbi:MAG: Na+/H+ antiporter NhaA [Acidobacteria bacterium]|nr:Na+/H+ antiporter NhaA [Acidobacteriota bacterium]